MSNLQHALALAARGFFVLPCEPNGKLPLIKDYPNKASRDEAQIRRWFEGHPDRNVAISTSRFGDDKAIVTIDVDTKEGKQGDQSLLGLELEGYDLPVTLEHSTANGGRHIIYVCDEPLRQGVNVLGPGLDIRSRGGYIVAPGSTIDGKTYQQINGHGRLAAAPDWLVSRLGADRKLDTGDRAPLAGVDPDRAADRASAYLLTAPVAVEGDGGDLTTYKVAAKLKDLGCTMEAALDLMAGSWNDRCTPPWPEDELADKVAHAYKYGREPQGVSAPEAVFPPEPPAPEDEDLHPFDRMNQDFAFIKKGAFVLQETTDPKGNFTTEHLSLQEFHAWFANVPHSVKKGKTVTISQCWIESSKRRQFEGVVFMPEQQAGERWYNLWRGFSVKPADHGNHPSVEAFKEHALQNVCGGDRTLYRWLMGYFAHMIQRPWEKPLVAIVFKGRKGTGKNALVERVGALFGPHFLVADDDRYLLSNFNSHLEANLFFVLDEAAWAGDKRAESRLKGLITGTHHNIERKGKEPYRVDNLTRVAIIGNEDWIVPATTDERRFAVFNVGTGRMQDRKFFHDMRVGMEQGGYAHLLRFFLDFDLAGVDVNDAPNTEGLVDQKMASLDPMAQWWHECLATGQLAGGDFGGEWPEVVPYTRFREAMARWSRGRNIKTRIPDEKGFGRKLKDMSSHVVRHRGRENDQLIYTVHRASLDVLRQDFEAWIGGKIQWNE